MINKVNVGEIVDVLQKIVAFAKSELSYDYSPPSDDNNTVIDLKPDSCSISLLANNAETVQVMDGGFVDRTSNLTTSLKAELWIKRNVIAKANFSISGISVNSSKSLFRSIKRMLLDNYPILVQSYIGRERKNNGELLCAPRTEVHHIEEIHNQVVVDEAFIILLENFSEELFSSDGIISNSVTFVNSSKCEFFVDEVSEIVQFKSMVQIVVSIGYINNNNLHVEDFAAEYFNTLPTQEDLNKLRERCLESVNNFMEFFPLTSSTYPVLLKPSASDVFFHEALAAHLLSATFVTGELGVNSTIFKDGIGREIPSLKGVNVVMDPGLNNGFGSYEYDHEGCKAEKIYLIKDGKILNYLTDRRSASYLEQAEKDKELINQLVKKIDINPTLLTEYVDEKHLVRQFENYKSQLKYLLEKSILDNLIENSGIDQSLNWRANNELLTKKSNGHCRVQSWVTADFEGYLVNVPSEARMSNLIVETDSDFSLFELNTEMVEYCKESGNEFYLEVGAHEGHVEVETGLFVISPKELVKVYLDGRREPVNPGTFSLNLEDFLSHIYMIGSECDNNRGFCGSASGFVPVGSRTPHMLLLDIPYQEAPDVTIAPDQTIQFLQHK